MKRGYGCLLINLLTIAVIFAAAVFCILTLIIFVNPAVPFNLFPPPTNPPIAVLPSATNTAIISIFPTFPATFTPPPTSTATQPPTRTATATRTQPLITDTAAATPTVDETQIVQLTQNIATNTPAPTNTSAPTFTPTKTRSAFPFTVQGDGPLPIQNFANSAGCNWMGIGGQVFNIEGNPIIGLVVHLEGGGQFLDAFTGTKTAYGAGGYEFFLKDRPIETKGEFKVQLLDQNGATPLSDLVVVDTFADCAKNLLLINFVQNH